MKDEYLEEARMKEGAIDACQKPEHIEKLLALLQDREFWQYHYFIIEKIITIAKEHKLDIIPIAFNTWKLLDTSNFGHFEEAFDIRFLLKLFDKEIPFKDNQKIIKQFEKLTNITIEQTIDFLEDYRNWLNEQLQIYTDYERNYDLPVVADHFTYIMVPLEKDNLLQQLSWFWYLAEIDIYGYHGEFAGICNFLESHNFLQENVINFFCFPNKEISTMLIVLELKLGYDIEKEIDKLVSEYYSHVRKIFRK